MQCAWDARARADGNRMARTHANAMHCSGSGMGRAVDATAGDITMAETECLQYQ